MITVRGLHKYFFRHKKNEIHVLNDMNISFPNKGLVVLLGASGSGKTTLLNVIGGLDSVQQGTIQFDEQIIQGYKSAVWDKIRNESIGYIFQNYNLLPHLSVFDNVGLVLKLAGITDPAVIDERVTYILKAVNMYPFRKKKSNQLSGGQQQRVAIARALVKNPRVIIADEPTGNLDSKNTLEIMNIIKEISKEKLVVLVTHEKDLAKIYGDRIIEIKDGQVMSDYENDPTHEHRISDDNIVYLKDMIDRGQIQSDAVKVQFFQDTDQMMDPINVRLIVRNRTLYLDVDSPIEKVKLIDEGSNLLIKDEHYVKKNKEEMLETSFRLEHLENKEVKREYKTIVSIKQIFMLALQKILYSSRKGKLMLFSFIISGAVIAIVVAMAASSIIPDLSGRRFEDNYVYINEGDKSLTYQELQTHLSGDQKAFINTTSAISIGIIDPIEPTKNLLSVDSPNDLIDHAKGRMVIGRRAINNDEFMMTLPLAESIIEGVGAEYGIWSINHLMSERFRVDGFEMKLTGIIHSDIKVTYTTRAFTNKVHDVNLDFFRMVGSLYLDEVTLTHGAVPTGNQVVISSELYDLVFNTDAEDQTFPVTTTGFDYQVAGVYDSENVMMIAPDIMVEINRFNQLTHYYVYTTDSKGLIEKVSDDVLQAYDIIEQIKLDFAESAVELRLTMSVIALVVIGFALLGFYFVMHSSMVSRIYELAVYRALGMKKTELMISFFIEVLIISTITSLIGYAFASYALLLANDTVLGMFRMFLVTPLSVLAGIVILYLVNLIGGMLPILLLLRKTPAQILAQYDI
ncbi:MAG: ABC transporter ATP-binding protein/permease [Acholeplasmataceae bacterium]|jgi:ABC-type lipoprotein export system ATPase subunit/ABC-type antimicrobial peptide transport system permease subunit|nr:ABC transporter ATP-binding protein/permease [Acholeplasmataceae bacterium]